MKYEFRAKPTEKAMELINKNYYFWVDDYNKNPMDEEGYIHGNLVDNYITGGVIESEEEYIALEYWCPIKPETIELVEEGAGE